MKTCFLYLMALLYAAAGINHFLNPKTYRKIMPPWIPVPGFFVFVSGVLEMVFALMLLPAKTRSIAAWCIIALLIAVFPANIQMAVNYRKRKSKYLWITLLRLPLQALLIWWAWLYTN